MGKIDDTQTVPLTEEQLIEKEADLKIREQALVDGQEALVLEKNNLEEEKASFEKEKEAFEIIKKDFDHKTQSKVVKKVAPIVFEFEGSKYQFSEKAPQSILLNGSGVSQKQIAKNDELKLQLIGANTGLIKKIK